MKKDFGKKVAILISVLGMLGFSTPVIADTKGERASCSQPVESIDSIILENAAKSKTVFFGESHWLSEDSEYVIHLLPELKKLGFSYLGLEVRKKPKEGGHSWALSKFIQDYKKGIPLNLNDYSAPLSGWVELTKTALDLGFEIVFFDESPEDVGGYGTPRDNAMLNNLKEKIFDKDPDAKAVIYCGSWHCAEQPIYEPSTLKKEETLGFLLEKYTGGRNYSIILRYHHGFEEILLKGGEADLGTPPTTNKTSGRISYLYDLDLSNHPLLGELVEEF
ncbi:MAG: hypothetical protein ISS23_03645 [Nanoarchaeota archaeon]|nr:hypothetical protein [Nanoarchaeota archaeon]